MAATVSKKHTGGSPAKTLEQHRIDGTFRPQRHAKLLPGFDLPKKPKPKRRPKKTWSRWVRLPEDSAALEAGCYFDAAMGQYVIEFFRTYLQHSKGEWASKPFELLDWQRELVMRLFGWMNTDGTRRFRRAYIEVPKKNGKSTLAAAISLYLLLADGEPGAEVYSAAADRAQASIVFTEAANMVERSPALAAHVKTTRASKRLVVKKTQSWYQALSADVPTKEGLNIHGLVFDELHAQTHRHLWDTLRYGGASRRQPVFLSITTAGYDRDTICFEQHIYAKNVLDGSAPDPAFFGYIAAAEDADDWTDVETWRKANPSYGTTIKADQFAMDFREAKDSLARQNVFRRYRLNQWTSAAVQWLDMERWDQCNISYDESELIGRKCFAGLDLASTSDTASLVLLFPEDGGRYVVLPFIWIPEDACRRRERVNKTRFDLWAQAGLVSVTSGATIDYDVIRETIVGLGERFHIQKVAIDRWNATQLAGQLVNAGFSVTAFGQGYASMSAPTKELESLVLSRRLAHGGHPILRWMADNVTVEQDAAGNLKPSKNKSTEKIDGIVALIMALGLAIAEPLQAESYYETHGVEVI